MSEGVFLELRVHTGIHAGARLRLTGSRYVFGSDNDCDVIFCDPGVGSRHAEISRIGKKWLLSPVIQENIAASQSQEIVPGTGVAIGPVIIEFADENSPWMAPLAVTVSVGVDKQEHPGISAQRASVSNALFQTSGEANDTPPPPRNFIAAAKRALLEGDRRSYMIIFKIAALPTLFFMLLSFYFLQQSHQTGAPEMVRSTQVLSMEKVSDEISKLNLSYRVQINHHPDQRLSVLASLLGDEELQKLSTTLSQFTPRPELVVLSEEDLIEEIQNILASHLTPLSADYLGLGRFRLNGIVHGGSEVAELMQRIAALLPMISVDEGGLMTKDALLAKVRAKMMEVGADEISGGWDGQTLILHAKVPRWHLRKWEASLANIFSPIAKLLQFKIHVEPIASAESELPFTIRGIVDGEAPCVVLSDRSKLFVGGTRQGWRLDAIDRAHIAFGGHKRVVIER